MLLKKFFLRYRAALLGLMCLGIMACLPSETRGEGVAPQGDKPLDVVASFTILGDLVSEIGGDRVKVVSLVGPNGDAHMYEPSPQDIRRAFEADLVILNGMGFEGAMDRLVPMVSASTRVVIAGKGIDPIIDVVNGVATPDPHAFHSIKSLKVYGDNILRALVALDPAGKVYYQGRWDAYQHRLDALDTQMHEIFDRYPPHRKTIITTHDAFSYFGRDYGLTFLTPLGTSTDEEPAAKHLVSIIEQAKDGDIGTVFVESTTSPRIMDQVAKEAGAVLGDRVYADALSTPQEGVHTIEAMFRHNARAFQGAIDQAMRNDRKQLAQK